MLLRINFWIKRDKATTWLIDTDELQGDPKVLDVHLTPKPKRADDRPPKPKPKT